MKFRFLLPAVLACVFPLAADRCLCDHADPPSLERPDCSLCKESDKQPATGDGFALFFLKDASPRKPNRTLALPVKHGKPGLQELGDLTPRERATLWKAAIAKAQELWPDSWGLAVNSSTVRTQCHLHIHIGRLLEFTDDAPGETIADPADFPVPELGKGVWLHPVPGGYHVHTDREIAEPVLLK